MREDRKGCTKMLDASRQAVDRCMHHVPTPNATLTKTLTIICRHAHSIHYNTHITTNGTFTHSTFNALDERRASLAIKAPSTRTFRVGDPRSEALEVAQHAVRHMMPLAYRQVLCQLHARKQISSSIRQEGLLLLLLLLLQPTSLNGRPPIEPPCIV